MLPLILGRSMIVRLLVAAAVFLLAFDGGSYSLVSRHSLAIAVWWVILLGVALGFWSPARLGRGAWMVGGFLALFTCWTFASTAWAASAEKAFLEGDRILLYLGVFLLVALAAQRSGLAAWCDGLAIGLVAVGVVALSTRFFPHLAPASDLVLFLPEAGGRLTYPVEYWNGLGILVALALPLLLRAAVSAPAAVARGLSLAPIPAVAATIFLTSSRGAAAVAFVGSAGFLVFSRRRWAAAGAIVLAAAGSTAAIAFLEARPELANAIGDAPAEQGPAVAALIALTCLVTGVAFAIGSALLRFQPPKAIGWGLVALLAGAVTGAVITADAAKRLETFKKTPAEVSLPEEGFVSAHLLSGGGSGRWQFWSAALDEFADDPVLGGGGGSYEAWWAQHGSFAYFVRDAHSLYLETLAELGIVGLTLLASAFVVGIAAGLRGGRHEGATRAALLAVFVAYALGAGIDWMWELTVVSAVGLACLGLLVSAGRDDTPSGDRGGRFLELRLVLVSAAAAAICAEALPMLTRLQIQESQAAVRRGDAVGAVEHAASAGSLQPWAASPRVQLALVHEREGDLEAARAAVGEALGRDNSDWRMWLIDARIQTKLGNIEAARRSLARAEDLNPRSPLFRTPRG